MDNKLKIVLFLVIISLSRLVSVSLFLLPIHEYTYRKYSGADLEI